MSITVAELLELSGHGKVLTEQGDKVGPVGEIYVDDVSGAPDWVTVRTGLFGTAETFVPLDRARVEGTDVVVPYAKDLIRDAPRIEVGRALSPQEEQVLHRHYDVQGSSSALGATGSQNGSVPSDEAEMTRSEERLVVGTERREAGRARLHRYVVTERVTQTVAVRHEEVRLTREPIADADRVAVTSSSVFGEENFEVVLHAETPVVEKTVVPVERIRLDTVTVTGQERVSADVRQERIELDTPTAEVPRTAGTDGEPGAHETKSPAGVPRSPQKGQKGKRRRR